MLSNDLKDDVVVRVSDFACQYKYTDSCRIPESDILDLVGMLESSGGISVSFLEKNPLNPVQTVMVALFIMGGSDSYISDVLKVSRNTVKGYFERIRDKFGVSTKHQAIMEAMKRGIVKFVC